jgi:hypothetical protein
MTRYECANCGISYFSKPGECGHCGDQRIHPKDKESSSKPWGLIKVILKAIGFLVSSVFVLTFVLVLFATRSTDAPSGTTEEIRQCTQKGVAYFKSIGSYPALISQENLEKSAEIAALERCGRTAHAFDGLDADSKSSLP